MTPLDVVRVRLQSQPTSSRTAAFSSSPFPTGTTRSFSNLPPSLGVTSCCREVFWVNNNAEFCVAGPNVAAYEGAAQSSAECAAEEAQRRTYTSTFDGLRKIAKNEGPTTLWRGLSPTLAMAVPGNVIYFAGYDWLRTSPYSPLTTHLPINEAYAPLVAGSVARVFAALFVSPIELFRTRMQVSQSATAAENFYTTLSGVRDMIASHGYLTLWRGLTLTLWRDVPFSAFYWWGYEATRNVITDARDRARLGDAATASKGPVARRRSDSRSRQNHSTTLVDSFAAGALAGGVASVVTTPFDVGKTRQQVMKHAGDTKGGAQASTAARPTMMRFIYQIAKEEGAAGLFKGWAPRCLKVAPACAIMISSYEMGKKMAQTMQNDKRELESR